jgi:hypothetical protein
MQLVFFIALGLATASIERAIKVCVYNCGGWWWSPTAHKRAGAATECEAMTAPRMCGPKVHYQVSTALGPIHNLSKAVEKLFLKGICLFHNSRTNIWHRPQQLPRWCAVIVSHSVARSSPLVRWVTTTTYHNYRHKFSLPLSIEAVARPKRLNK